MPELPEVQNVRQSLAARVLGHRVVAITLKRQSVITGSRQPSALLRGHQLVRIDRLGKQMALFANTGRDRDDADQPCVCIHLGMTGSLRHLSATDATHANKDRQIDGRRATTDKHAHVTWMLDDGSRVVFRDPRRFGGLWTFPNAKALWASRWGLLGPDALSATAGQLARSLSGSRRPIKSALLDQRVVAGLGNIYVDELLFACGIHPLTPCYKIDLHDLRALVRRMRSLLDHAIRLGGSTLRDYTDADGQSGLFQDQHKVYGRSGQDCLRCGRKLNVLQISGRTTVYCDGCQE